MNLVSEQTRIPPLLSNTMRTGCRAWLVKAISTVCRLLESRVFKTNTLLENNGACSLLFYEFKHGLTLRHETWLFCFDDGIRQNRQQFVGSTNTTKYESHVRQVWVKIDHNSPSSKIARYFWVCEILYQQILEQISVELWMEYQWMVEICALHLKQKQILVLNFHSFPVYICWTPNYPGPW